METDARADDAGSRGPSDLFRALAEAAPDAMIVVGSTGAIELVNAQAEALFGYRREELIGHSVEILLPERLRSAHVAHRKGFMDEPERRPMGTGVELLARRKNGTEVPVEISLSPLELPGGTLVAAAIRDVSDRKKIEQETRLASDRLQSAVESIPGMLAMFDAEDRLVLCNSACRAFLTKVVPEPLSGQTFVEIITTAAAGGLFTLGGDSADAFVGRLLAYHRNPVGTLDFSTPDGSFLRISDTRTLEGGVVVTVWDVTDDIRHEAELRQAHDLAEAASKAKSEFLSSMSHELRTPLNSILGFAELLQRDKRHPLSDRQKQQLDYVLKGGEHLLRLIDDVLDLSRIETGQVLVSVEPVEVGEVIREVLTTLKPMAVHAGITLELSSPPETPLAVLADRTRLSQALINFGSNAVKYGRRGGKATITVSESSERTLRIGIADDGIGIPLDKQDRIFQPFHRAGQEAGPIQGTGIGLSITKRLAELMGGSVGFTSEPGRGSLFWIELRLHHDSQRPPATAAGAASKSTLTNSGDRRYSVVYIEDNPSNIAFMQAVVAELDRVDLVSVPSAEVGIELVRARRPDVVIMDINLPGMNGYEATKRLQEWPETREIPVIALSAAAMPRDREHGSKAGFYRYLTKPARVAELVETLQELLEKRGSRPEQ